ncbi:MAG: phenylalanine--tRNA ligase subunit beta [Deltaproteobacteria bacterium]|nr:phenylalanine--tRNA ligase subunit beta [Deltaproteobacteria bacterium]
MRISFNWLRDFLPTLPRDPVQVAADLTRLGFEVEGTTHLGRGLSGLLVAEVLAYRPHPQASKLRIVTVKAGARTDEVVCGAANVPEPGGKVCWAPPGATLPGFTMAAKEIRGVMSPGMLCSEEELGLAPSADGILILDADAPSGADPVSTFGLADTVFEVNVTPNRGDALSHLGLARELAAAYSAELVMPATPALKVGAGAQALDVVIQDNKACRRYQARFFANVVVGPSPLAMRMRLLACGVRSISNLVDITNYVLLELGHPLHAFDLDKVKGAVYVRRAHPGERLVTLDGVERVLEAGDTVIADEQSPIALAGVMGGQSTEIGPNTKNVLLETATFDPVSVRKTAKRLSLHSEASHRFERGVDSEGIARAAARAAELICGLAQAQQADQVVDRYPSPPTRRQASLTLATLRKLSGDTNRNLEGAKRTLSRLCDEVRITGHGDSARLDLGIPSYRPDLSMEADLVEEVLRHEGYESVVPRRMIFNAKAAPNPEAPSDLARARFVSAGLNEVVTWGFVPSGWLSALAPAAPEAHQRLVRGLAVSNPISADYEVMRTSLLPGLVETAKRNLSRGVQSLALFEVGPVVERAEQAGHVTAAQQNHASALLCGLQPGWLRPGAAVDFFDLKRVAAAVLAGFALQDARYVPVSDVPFLHPGVGASIEVQGQRVGLLGELHPRTRKALRLTETAFYLELYLDQFPAAAAAIHPILPPRYPATTRDISFWVDESVTAQAQQDALWSTPSPLLRAVSVLEDFRDPKYVPAKKKGMLWTLTYRADDRTLTDAEVDAAHAGVLAALQAAFPLQLR